MKRSIFHMIQVSPYWNGWVLSVCLHTVMVGLALFLSHQLPTPQKAERNPIAVSFFTPQITQPLTQPTHRPTMKKAPPTPTTQSKQVQPEPISKEPTQSKPRMQIRNRHTVSPQMIVQPSLKPALLPQPVTRTTMAQPKTSIHPQTTSQPTIRNGTISTQPIATRSSPLRQSVNTLPSHDEKRTRAPAMAVMKQPQHVTRGKSHTAVRQAFSKPARQQASRSSGSPVVQTRTTVNYASQTRRTRPATTSRAVSTDGFSPELLAFSKLLRERIAQTLEFPRLAKRLGYSGTTHIALALSKTGIVRVLKVSQPSGYDILDKAALVTLNKVLPTMKPPESIEIEELVVPIAFNLKRN